MQSKNSTWALCQVSHVLTSCMAKEPGGRCCCCSDQRYTSTTPARCYSVAILDRGVVGGRQFICLCLLVCSCLLVTACACARVPIIYCGHFSVSEYSSLSATDLELRGARVPWGPAATRLPGFPWNQGCHLERSPWSQGAPRRAFASHRSARLLTSCSGISSWFSLQRTPLSVITW